MQLSQGGHNLGVCISERPRPLSQGRIPGMPDRCRIYMLQDPEIQAGFTAAAQLEAVVGAVTDAVIDAFPFGPAAYFCHWEGHAILLSICFSAGEIQLQCSEHC